jgi:hypothetical protein
LARELTDREYAEHLAKHLTFYCSCQKADCALAQVYGNAFITGLRTAAMTSVTALAAAMEGIKAGLKAEAIPPAPTVNVVVPAGAIQVAVPEGAVQITNVLPSPPEPSGVEIIRDGAGRVTGARPV